MADRTIVFYRMGSFTSEVEAKATDLFPDGTTLVPVNVRTGMRVDDEIAVRYFPSDGTSAE
jgi:hypothetical protein